jgi:hypothetical protein
MADELRPDDIPDLWREEPQDPVRISTEEIRRRARQFEAATRRGFRVTGIMMLCAFAGYAFLLYLFPGVPQRVGCTLTLVAYLYCAYQFSKKGPVNELLAQAPAATISAYRSELERLRDFSFISKLMVPFVPGPAVFVLGFLVPSLGLLKAVGLTAALIASPFIVAIPLAHRSRLVLENEIRSLDALTR